LEVATDLRLQQVRGRSSSEVAAGRKSKQIRDCSRSDVAKVRSFTRLEVAASRRLQQVGG
jgi:hypothetical protein